MVVSCLLWSLLKGHGLATEPINLIHISERSSSSLISFHFQYNQQNPWFFPTSPSLLGRSSTSATNGWLTTAWGKAAATTTTTTTRRRRRRRNQNTHAVKDSLELQLFSVPAFSWSFKPTRKKLRWYSQQHD